MGARLLALNTARLVFAGTAVVAITYQFAVARDHGASAGNFFSFFTIHMNALAVVALCALVLVRPGERTALFDGLRGAVVLYIAVGGAVFALLLAGLQEHLQTTVPWVDFVVHTLMPIVLVADWLVDPPRHRLPVWTAAAWLSFPVAWFVYTLVRGAIVGWYPYPFVDVTAHGYAGVLARAIVLLVGFAIAGAVLLAVGNLRVARADRAIAARSWR